MRHASIIGIDLAKRSFQLHGAQAYGSVAFRRKLSREQVLDFLFSQPRCEVAMEACARGRSGGHGQHRCAVRPVRRSIGAGGRLGPQSCALQ